MSNFQQAVRLLSVAQYIDELVMSSKLLPPPHREILERRLAELKLTTARVTLKDVINELSAPGPATVNVG